MVPAWSMNGYPRSAHPRPCAHLHLRPSPAAHKGTSQPTDTGKSVVFSCFLPADYVAPPCYCLYQALDRMKRYPCRLSMERSKSKLNRTYLFPQKPPLPNNRQSRPALRRTAFGSYGERKCFAGKGSAACRKAFAQRGAHTKCFRIVPHGEHALALLKQKENQGVCPVCGA